VDVLSEVLRAVTLQGAVFYNAEFSSPWGFRSPASQVIARHFGPGTGHVIIYHLLTEGSAWVQLDRDDRVDLVPGDIVVFPHGNPHRMGHGEAVQPVDNSTELDRIFSQGLQAVRLGGGGAVTRLVCGYMTCEPQMCRLVLAGLPPLVRVNIRNDESGTWLENSIRFSVSSAGTANAGAEAVLAKLSEALFTETLRRYIAVLPSSQTGWLAGARDPEVGRALGFLHSQPAHPWTIGALAQSVGVSRAVLAERFRQFLGEPPITYLTRWRLHLGARLLAANSQSVAQIASQVGYESEAAFNRAFKRFFTVPPARFRRDSRSRAANSGEPENEEAAGA
jgi:AraC-like DNA-binding protein